MPDAADLDAYAATLVRKTGHSCAICELPEEHRKWVEAAKDRGYSTRVVYETLRAHCGYTLGRSPIERHLREHVKRG